MGIGTVITADADGHSAAEDRRRIGLTESSSLPVRIPAGEVMSSPAGTIDADASLWQAAHRLVDGAHRHLVIVDGGRPVGVIDDNLLAQQWPCGPFAARQRTLRQIAPGRVHTVMPHVTISRVAAIMYWEGVDAVPVVDGRGRLLGLITAADLVRLLAREHRSTP